MEEARFIIRFDDICSTFRWDIWNRVVEVLDKYEIKPIIAVIPSNEDPALMNQPEKTDFWDHIRAYQKQGWMIALHGCNHRYTNHKSGIMGISANSEFAGLSYEAQFEKISEGVKVFKRENVKIDAFIAPSHSFDKTTLKILKEFDIKVISDGHLREPYTKDGMLWIPCQLWEHFNVSKSGTYTVCYHPNKWTEKEFSRFQNGIDENYKKIISPFEITTAPRITTPQRFENRSIALKFKIKRAIKKMLRYQSTSKK